MDGSVVFDALPGADDGHVEKEVQIGKHRWNVGVPTGKKVMMSSEGSHVIHLRISRS
ncbi:hypothetical protein J7E91_02935 [Streptomyces sp. ISL-99]|uniref:hypothetical protein n=1 Tax=Streptomyces sp. ISL-99 TaxID=2819193 RepID=UPI001BE7AF1B|nr:hypothetical protein [Streptomyces sp. ISL-99]MBT2524413.1 hypothetical protein [Streptomyces sp. ISL-99]